MIIYGIPNCDTVKKARVALPGAAFRDIRAEPLTEAERAEFIAAFGDAVINRSSMTWRKLTSPEQGQSSDALLLFHPTLMKRPVIRDDAGRLHLGWSAATQQALGL